MTPTPTRPRPSPPRWGLAMFVCAVLLGLLGMHALAMTCGLGPPMPPDTASTVAIDTVPAEDVSAGHDADTSHGTAAMDHDQHSTGQAGADGSMSSALMSVCVGLLVSAMVLLAAVLSILTQRGWQVPTLRLTDLRWARLPTRQPPPSLTLSQLCLLRC